MIDETQPSPTAQTAAMTEKVEFQLHINGHDHSVRVEPRKTLADRCTPGLAPRNVQRGTEPLPEELELPAK